MGILVSGSMDGFKDIYGGFEIGKRNAEGLRLLEFCEEHDLADVNTFLICQG